ncbi:alpha/beta fold hydrolase [Photobacterium sp. 53610]|uniref:alpha/beta fold hydrolase n=1 Tax=Photobacterium sp. 53610 TaxID=3102789 RepID=UPI002ED991D1
MMYECRLPLAESELAIMTSFPPCREALAQGKLVSAAELSDQRPTLVFLHGWHDNAASFTPLFEPLSAAFHLVSVDWPGHGLSEHRGTDNYYYFMDYVDDLAQIRQALAGQSVILVGHSLGALVAAAYAGAFPETLAGLVLIEGLAPLCENAELAADRLRQGIESRMKRRQRVSKRLKLDSFQAALTVRCRINGLDAEQLRPLVQRATYRDGDHWYWRHDDKLRCDSLIRMTEMQAKTLMSGIACPVLSVLGERGFTYLKEPDAGLSWVPQAAQITVPGGHHCHLESPRQVCEQILLFTSKIKKLV